MLVSCTETFTDLVHLLKCWCNSCELIQSSHRASSCSQKFLMIDVLFACAPKSLGYFLCGGHFACWSKLPIQQAHIWSVGTTLNLLSKTVFCK